MGNYNLNTYDLLCNNNIKFSQLFHKACWLAIEDCIKSKNKDLQTIEGFINHKTRNNKILTDLEPTEIKVLRINNFVL